MPHFGGDFAPFWSILPHSGGILPQSGGILPQSGGFYPILEDFAPFCSILPHSGGIFPSSGGILPHSGGILPHSGAFCPMMRWPSHNGAMEDIAGLPPLILGTGGGGQEMDEGPPCYRRGDFPVALIPFWGDFTPFWWSLKTEGRRIDPLKTFWWPPPHCGRILPPCWDQDGAGGPHLTKGGGGGVSPISGGFCPISGGFCPVWR